MTANEKSMIFQDFSQVNFIYQDLQPTIFSRTSSHFSMERFVLITFIEHGLTSSM